MPAQISKCGLITNGWFLARHIGQLAAAGLKRLLISIDSTDMTGHERNRGLRGLEARIGEGIARAHTFRIPVCASVTVNRLGPYESLPKTLARRGFDAVTFSCPGREPFGFTSLVYDEKSTLVDLSRDELLDALNESRASKSAFV